MNTITPADLPASFDTVAQTARDMRALAPQLHRLVGVDQVMTPPPARDLRRFCKVVDKTRRENMFDKKWCRPYR